jgi:tyrosyl-tRNA synthetase
MSMEELYRLVRHPTIARLLERDDFATRYAAHQPISLLELLYPVLQGYDSVCVRADVELGGTDQKFNLLMGRDLQGAYGQPEQIVLTTPLINGTDGARKMSKSYGNQVGITDPPKEMYGRTLSIPDALLGEWYDVLLGTGPPAGAGGRDAKRALARALVDRFHGAGAGAAAEAHFDRVFVRREAPDDLEEATFTTANGSVHLPALIAELFGGSRSDARRALAQGGVKIDGQALRGDALDVEAAGLDGRVLQLGKRRFKRLRLR